MKPFRLIVATSLLLVGAVAPPALAADQGKQTDEAPSQKVVKIKDARLKFEINSTDRDAGVQVFLDADPWKTMSIYDPNGRLIYTTSTHGSMGEQGGTELFLESAEPTLNELPIERLFERFPEGDYRFRGEGLDGERYVGSAHLTHDLPDGPTLVSPLEGGDPQHPQNTTVVWEPVDPPNGSPIIGYQVLVVDPDTGITALPKVILDVMMPPTATSMAVPPGFLQPNTEYEWEVLAIEESGNQTLSSSFFTTSA
jgi:Fibronectin type III domain